MVFMKLLLAAAMVVTRYGAAIHSRRVWRRASGPTSTSITPKRDSGGPNALLWLVQATLRSSAPFVRSVFGVLNLIVDTIIYA